MESFSCCSRQRCQKRSLCNLACLITLCAIACSHRSFSIITVAASKKDFQSSMVQALKREADYSIAAAFLGSVDLSYLLPENSTILVPMDDSLAQADVHFSTFSTVVPILQYHVIPHRLVFHDLQQLPVGQTLETLLLNNTIIITRNSLASFTIDDVPISRRNIFVSISNVVHGINGVLNFAMYGKMKRIYDFHQSAPPSSGPADGIVAPSDQLSSPPKEGDASDDHVHGSPFPADGSIPNFPPPSAMALAPEEENDLPPPSPLPSSPESDYASNISEKNISFDDHKGGKRNPSDCTAAPGASICKTISSSTRVGKNRSIHYVSMFPLVLSGMFAILELSAILGI
ncbi:hypothetical protein KP509_27G033900 [Ceratopteris richardii]|uniref:FAS1 domain-containing protein n=1 Tax=Ceratopteris richardii TaxID=49495 RepID=A0A8T2RHS9_CERRI|nr:hypothetical protein KP509_27G033900 [Ceratopteris richardii]